MGNFRTVANRVDYEPDPIKGSRFIGSVAPANTQEDAKAFIDEIREQHSGATHHCWAFRLHEPSISRSSDDGEPGGSAGRPMLAILDGRGLENVVAVVTRYYGGTKLGVGGLIRAYSGAAAMAFDRATLLEVLEHRSLTVEHGYELTSVVEAFITRESLQVKDRIYGDGVRVIMRVPCDDYERLCSAIVELSGGKAAIIEASR